jgi:hypothetical protein
MGGTWLPLCCMLVVQNIYGQYFVPIRTLNIISLIHTLQGFWVFLATVLTNPQQRKALLQCLLCHRTLRGKGKLGSHDLIDVDKSSHSTRQTNTSNESTKF